MSTFLETIDDLGHGKVADRLDADLRELVAAVEDVQKPGAIQLTITVDWDGGIAKVTAEVKSKIPKKALPGAMFYFGQGDGQLYRDDPRQLELKGIAEPPMSLKNTVPLRAARGEE